MRKRLGVVPGRLIALGKRSGAAPVRLIAMGKRLGVVPGRLIALGKPFITMGKPSGDVMKPSVAMTRRSTATRNRGLTKNRHRLGRFIDLRRGIAIRARTVSVKVTKARQWGLVGPGLHNKQQKKGDSHDTEQGQDNKQAPPGNRRDPQALRKRSHDLARWHTDHAERRDRDGLLTDLKTLVKSQLGSSEGVLGDFGFSNPKRQTPDEATKAAAVVKRAATRDARHTMGKRQKAGIKGTVPATTAPVATSGTSSSGATPASPVVPAASATTSSRS